MDIGVPLLVRHHEHQLGLAQLLPAADWHAQCWAFDYKRSNEANNMFACILSIYLLLIMSLEILLGSELSSPCSQLHTTTYRTRVYRTKSS